MSALLPDAAWVPLVGWTLVHFVWQGTLVHGLLLLALRAVPVSWSQTRYALACLALLLMASLPVATALWLASQPLLPTWPAFLTVSTAQAETLTPAFLPWLVGAWLAGVLFLLIRLSGGWLLTRGYRSRHVMPAPAALKQLALRLEALLGIRQCIRILQSAKAPVPMVVGILKPVVILPTCALTGLSRQQLEFLIAHELAHIKRLDPLLNLLQGVLETMLFYHPSVWAVSEIIRNEREYCCDEAALMVGGNRVAYATALRDLAGLQRVPTGLSVAASGGSLARRVRRILFGPETLGRPNGLATALAGIGITVLLGIAVAVSASPDPLRQIMADASTAGSLSSDQLNRALRSAPRTAGLDLVLFLDEVAPYALPGSPSAGSYLMAVATLPDSQRQVVLHDYLTLAGSEAARRERP